MPTRKFPGRLENLEKICEFVTEHARAAGLDECDLYAVQLAVDEAATNIIEHAYGGEDLGEIECTCEILSDGLKVTLRDHGRKFDPNDVPEPVVNANLEELKPRGLGVFFIRKMMDEVQYEFTPNNGNTLTMVKRKGPRA